MSTSTSLIRVPLTLATALAFHLSMTPPTRPEFTDALSDKEKRICSCARVIVLALTKGIYWATTLSDISSHVHFPVTIPPSLSTFALTAVHEHTPFIVGTAFAITGALLRLSAQRTLGRFYADSRPRPGHALFTDGPYKVVRHPGYAGLSMCTMGVMMVHFGAGVGAIRWNLGHSADVHAVISPVWIALAGAVFGTVCAIRRIEKEEETLKERFKSQWDQYAARVRYRLIPGIY